MKITQNIHSSGIALIHLLVIALLFGGCNKDDDTSIPYEVEGVEELTAPNGLITLTTREKELNIGLNDGSLLEETLFTDDQKDEVHHGNLYEFNTNTIVKKAEGSSLVAWEKSYPEEAGKSLKMFKAHTAFSENTLFISYTILDTNTYESMYFLEALNLENGDTIWKLNAAGKTYPHFYQNRLVTVQYPNGNATVVFQYRNKQLGDVEAERMIPERINEYSFDGDLIIAHSWNNRVVALDRGLNIAWSFDTEGANPGVGLLFENQYIFFSRDRHIYSLNKNSGILNWKTAMPEGLIMGLHINRKNLYIGQQTGLQILTLSNVNTENGELASSFETSMSNDSYTTKLAFYKAYVLVAMAPSSDEDNPEIEARLLHLPSTKELWSADLSFKMAFFRAMTIDPNGL